MEDILKMLLVEEIKKERVSLRDIQEEIDKICDNDKAIKWMSLSTLSRRIKEPLTISEEEFSLLRQAYSNSLSKVEWTNIKRTITEKLKYSGMLESAINNGFALHQNLVDYDNTQNELFSSNVLKFYKQAPENCRKYWNEILETYLLLPDLAKASIMCASYIGRSVQENTRINAKAFDFLRAFPIFEGAGQIATFTDAQIDLLSKIMGAASSCSSVNAPEIYREYAIDIKKIPKFNNDIIYPNNIEEERIVSLVKRYQNTVTDFKVCEYDFIKGLSFILFIDKIEWMLAFAASIFSFRLFFDKERLSIKREYFEKGCTGFRFTNEELGFLYSLIAEIEQK